MDSRHESLKEGFLNHLIVTINTYMVDNIDSFIVDEPLQTELRDICKRIYHYLGVDVDTENILSKHNLLSKDVVVFPAVPDPEGSKILKDDEFNHLIILIKKSMEIKAETNDDRLRKQILHVIDEYEL
jgi:hypothetical protein